MDVFHLQNRFVCRDIGGSDPERMAAPRVEEYITELFGCSSGVKVSRLAVHESHFTHGSTNVITG